MDDINAMLSRDMDGRRPRDFPTGLPANQNLNVSSFGRGAADDPRVPPLPDPEHPPHVAAAWRAVQGDADPERDAQAAMRRVIGG